MEGTNHPMPMADIIQLMINQSPIIIVMSIVGYVMWNYIKEKNAIIKSKDELIIEQTEKLMELYGAAVESQNNLTKAIDELRKDFDRKHA
jgi:hypothetical protein